MSEDVRARGAPGDDAGHVIAKRFGADFNFDTAVPQNSNLNRGAYRSMERELATHVSAGRTVDVVVEIKYAARSTRPSNFTVRANINGVEDVWSFANAPGGR